MEWSRADGQDVDGTVLKSHDGSWGLFFENTKVILRLEFENFMDFNNQ